MASPLGEAEDDRLAAYRKQLSLIGSERFKSLSRIAETEKSFTRNLDERKSVLPERVDSPSRVTLGGSRTKFQRILLGSEERPSRASSFQHQQHTELKLKEEKDYPTHKKTPSSGPTSPHHSPSIASSSPSPLLAGSDSATSPRAPANKLHRKTSIPMSLGKKGSIIFSTNSGGSGGSRSGSLIAKGSGDTRNSLYFAFDIAFSVLIKVGTMDNLLDHEILTRFSPTLKRFRGRGMKEHKDFQTMGQVLQYVKSQCSDSSSRSFFGDVPKDLQSRIYRNLSAFTSDTRIQILKEKKTLPEDDKDVDGTRVKVVTKVVFMFQLCISLYHTISSKCHPQKCPEMDVDGGDSIKWQDLDSSSIPISTSAKEFIALVTEWIIKQLTSDSYFPRDGGRSFPSSVDSVLKTITKFLFLIMHHIYYKHRDDLLKKYESKVPTHASQIDMAIRDGSTLSEINTLLETCTPADLPLTAAVEQCSLEVVSLFLQKGANPDSGNPPPLLVATRAGLSKMVNTLLEYGANPQTTDESGRTILHLACCMGHENVVQSLIDFGVSELGMNSASSISFQRMWHSRKKCFFAACAFGRANVVRILLKSGMDPNILDENGRSALFFAIKNGSESLMLVLLNHGANPNQPAKELKTPLYYAVQYNKDTIAELLLQFGANPDMHIQGCGTALHACIKAKNEVILAYLIKAGADPFDCRIVEEDGRSCRGLEGEMLEKKKLLTGWSFLGDVTFESAIEMAQLYDLSVHYFDVCRSYDFKRGLRSVEDKANEHCFSLALTGFQFSRIPKFIWADTTLRHLDISHNCLKELPSSIGCLTALETLDVSYNQLDTLPLELGALELLKELKVKGNPLKSFPDESLVERTTEDILSFLKRLPEQNIPWKRVKVVVLGRENVGKTTLVKSMISEMDPSSTRPNVSTEGIEISTWNPLKEETVELPRRPNKTEMKNIFQIWDFGGQEVFYPTHQFFLSCLSVFVVVFSLKDPDFLEKVEYWMESIRSIGVGGGFERVVLVGSHLDECTSSERVPQIHQMLNRKYGGVRIAMVNCRSSDMVKTVGQSVIQASRHYSLDIKVSGSQLFLCQKILSLQEERAARTLKWEQFRELAKDCGLSPVQISETSRLFHDLGVILCFQEFVQKENERFIVLDPAWLVEVMAKLINVRTQMTFVDGRVSNFSLAQVWKGYEPEEQDHFIQVLEGLGIMYVCGEKEPEPPQQSHQLHFPNGSSSVTDVFTQHSPRTRVGTFLSPQSPPSSPLSSTSPSPPSPFRKAPTMLSLSPTSSPPSPTPPFSRGKPPLSFPSGSLSPPNSPPTVPISSLSSPSKQVLIPCLLQNQSSEARTRWFQDKFEASFCRLYRFTFLPMGFLPLLLFRFISHFPTSIVWKNGIYVSEDRTKSFRHEAFIEYFPQTKTLILLIRPKRDFESLGTSSGDEESSVLGNLLEYITTNISSILKENYSQAYDEMVQYVPCRHCITKILSGNKIISDSEFQEISDLDVMSFLGNLRNLSPTLYLPPSRCKNPPVRLSSPRKLSSSSSSSSILDRFHAEEPSPPREQKPNIHLFLSTDIQLSLMNDLMPYMFCPIDSVCVRVTYLCPDMVLCDVPKVERLDIIEKLGEGGQAIVFRGHMITEEESDDCETSIIEKKVEVAVKIFSATGTHEFDTFLQEASIMSILNHPNLVHMYGTCLLREYQGDWRVEGDILKEAVSIGGGGGKGKNIKEEEKGQSKMGMVFELVKESDLQKLLDRRECGIFNENVMHESLPITLARKDETCSIVRKFFIEDGRMVKEDEGEQQEQEQQEEEEERGEKKMKEMYEVELDHGGMTMTVPVSQITILSLPLKDEEIPWLFRVKIALDVAKAMNYLHSLVPPVAHRDLRSPNVFLVSRDRHSDVVAKVADFGMAALTDIKLKRQLMTWQWLAPEVIRLTRAGYDARSDIYSFGMLLYEIATRKCPFLDDDFGFKTKHQFIEAIVSEGLRPRVNVDEVPKFCKGDVRGWKNFCELMKECWEASPDERPSWNTIIKTLETILGTPPIKTIKTTLETATNKRRVQRKKFRHKFEKTQDCSFGFFADFAMAGCRVCRPGWANSVMPRRILASEASFPPPPAVESYSPSGRSKSSTNSVGGGRKMRSEIWILFCHNNIRIYDANSLVELEVIENALRRETLGPRFIGGMVSFVDGLDTKYVAVVTTQETIHLFLVESRRFSRKVERPSDYSIVGSTACVLNVAKESQLWTGDMNGVLRVYSYASEAMCYQSSITLCHAAQCMCRVDEDIWVAGGGIISVVDAKGHILKHVWQAHTFRKIDTMIYIQGMERVWSVDETGRISVWSTQRYDLVKSKHVNSAGQSSVPAILKRWPGYRSAFVSDQGTAGVLLTSPYNGLLLFDAVTMNEKQQLLPDASELVTVISYQDPTSEMLFFLCGLQNGTLWKESKDGLV